MEFGVVGRAEDLTDRQIIRGQHRLRGKIKTGSELRVIQIGACLIERCDAVELCGRGMAEVTVAGR